MYELHFVLLHTVHIATSTQSPPTPYKHTQVAAATSTTTRAPQRPTSTNPSTDLVQLSAVVRILAVMAAEQDLEREDLQGPLREVYGKQDVEPLPSDMVQGVVDVLYDKYVFAGGGGGWGGNGCLVWQAYVVKFPTIMHFSLSHTCALCPPLISLITLLVHNLLVYKTTGNISLSNPPPPQPPTPPCTHSTGSQH